MDWDLAQCDIVICFPWFFSLISESVLGDFSVEFHKFQRAEEISFILSMVFPVIDFFQYC